MLLTLRSLFHQYVHTKSQPVMTIERAGNTDNTHKHTHTALPPPLDQTLPPFFSIYAFPPRWLSPWSCYFIPSSWWVSLILLWDVCLSHSTIKGPVRTCVCLVRDRGVDEWAVSARSRWKQGLSNRIPWRQRSQWGEERSGHAGRASRGLEERVIKAQTRGRRCWHRCTHIPTYSYVYVWYSHIQCRPCIIACMHHVCCANRQACICIQMCAIHTVHMLKKHTLTNIYQRFYMLWLSSTAGKGTLCSDDFIVFLYSLYVTLYITVHILTINT